MKKKIIPTIFTLALTVSMSFSTFAATSYTKIDKQVKSSKNVDKAIEKVKVNLSAGELIGYEDNGVYNFKGIPYATAERFKNPVAVTSYENGKQLALSYGAVAPQNRTLNGTGTISSSDFITPSGTTDQIANENCQNLNVWTKSMNGSKPVIVFFHGGGLSSGSSTELSAYDGSYVVENQDVVFISVNHRLNVLGYLDLSEYGKEYKDSSRLGTLDCVEALKWVHENISKFGGNPNNVTIVGQSGGGKKLAELASMPETEGLFDKVVMMSASYQENGKDNTKKLINYLNIPKEKVIDTLTNMSCEELLNAANNAGCSWSTYYGEDDTSYPLFDKNGNLNKSAAKRTYLWGTTYSEFSSNIMSYINSDDEKFNISKSNDNYAMAELVSRYGNKVKDFAESYKKAYPEHSLSESLYLNNDLGEAALSRYNLIKNNGILDKLNKSGAKVYNYVVAYKQPFMGGVDMFHSGDIAYWFDSIDKLNYLTHGDTENANTVANTMSSALAAFAATGNPTAQIEWKPYTLTEHNTMVFDSHSELKNDFDKDLYDIMAETSISK